MTRFLISNKILKGVGLLLWIAIAFSACKEDKTFDPKLVLNTGESLSVSNKTNEQTIDIVANGAWTATADVDWITFSKSEGEKGKSVVQFSISENIDDQRIGTISVSTTSGNVQQVFQVVQESGLTTHLYVKTGGTGAGYSWDDATNLAEALKNSVSGSTIYIAAGTHVPTETLTSGDALNKGDLTFELNKYITLKGGYPVSATGRETTGADPSVHKTILSGKLESGDNAYHVVTITAPKVEGQKVVLEGLTIRDGNGFDRGSKVSVNGTDFARGNGGGIAIGNAKVDLINVDVVDNKTSGSGGTAGYAAGIFAFGGSEVTLRGCKINNNECAGNGGGLWVDRSLAYLYDCEVNGNSGGTAPGVHAYPDATVYMYNTVVADNKGKSFGAAVYLRDNSKGILVNCLIYGNESTSKNGGGGLMMYDDCEADVISSTITRNKIAGPGGGIYRRLNTNKIRIYNSIVSGNEQMDDGPDVDVFEDTAVAPLIQASVIGTMVYNATGSVVSGTTFNPATMLSTAFLAVGDNNPALQLGMASNALVALGGTYSPALEDLLSADLNGADRSGLTTMGALVK